MVKVLKAAAGSEEKGAAKKKANPDAFKKVGIGAFIEDKLVKAGKKGITRAAILKALCKKFPERAESGMKKTVGVTVPLKLSKKYVIKKKDNDRYWIKSTIEDEAPAKNSKKKKVKEAPAKKTKKVVKKKKSSGKKKKKK
jgi:hypothetical protein